MAWYNGLSDEIAEMFDNLEGIFDIWGPQDERVGNFRAVDRTTGKPRGRAKGQFGVKAKEGLRLLAEGKSQAEVSRELKVDRTVVRRWQKAANDNA